MGNISEDFAKFRSPGGMQGSCVGTAIASAVACPAPTAYITPVSGVAAISTIAIPYPGFTGQIILLPTGAFSGVTGGVADGINFPLNAAIAAVTPGKPLSLIFDGNKWYS